MTLPPLLATSLEQQVDKSQCVKVLRDNSRVELRALNTPEEVG